MKAALTSGLIFLLMLLGIAVNRGVLVSKTDRLLFMLSTADMDVQAIGEIKREWEQTENLFQVSVSHARTDLVHDLLDSLEIYACEKDETEYKKTAVLLRNALKEFRIQEEISAANIL